MISNTPQFSVRHSMSSSVRQSMRQHMRNNARQNMNRYLLREIQLMHFAMFCVDINPTVITHCCNVILQECQTRYEQQCQTTYEQQCQTTYEEVCEEALPQYTSYGAPSGYGAPKQCKQVRSLINHSFSIFFMLLLIGSKATVPECAKAAMPKCA